MSFKLYLMRHAQSETGPMLDPTRKLTDTGKAQAHMMAKWLKRQAGDKQPGLIIQSNMHRSQSTAKRLAKRIDAPVVTHFSLDPDAAPAVCWYWIRKLARKNDTKRVIAVTHGPLIEKMLAYLTNSPSAAPFHVAHGSIAYFKSKPPAEITEAGGYTYEEVEMKRWNLGSGGQSGENCDTCEENADRGWIDMDDVYQDVSGGDLDEAPAHPNCDCEVEFKTRRRRVYEAARGDIEDSPQQAYLHWLVTPNTVARDEDEMDLVSEAATAALTLAEIAAS